MAGQLVTNQKGEIEFRKKLYLQQVVGQPIFDNEFDAAGIERILDERMKKTSAQATLLQQRGIPLSPYIEIGAERCQRSLVMENDFGAHGAAVDISYEMLKSCDHYQHVFKRAKCPLRICCDAYNLPFMTDSISFVFCYETLHHFPDPVPITGEVHRVIARGGYFFFDEEPYRNVLHVNLYRGSKIYSKEALNRTTVRKILDRFFCKMLCNEEEHGIIENHSIPLRLWKEALAYFEEKDVDLRVAHYVQSKMFNPASYFKYVAASLLGGSISGLCQKLDGDSRKRCEFIENALICPSCREKGKEVPVNRKASSLVCPGCSSSYPITDGVVFLLTHDKLAELYPETFSLSQAGKKE
jgi:SAM-dependent methyltransferase